MHFVVTPEFKETMKDLKRLIRELLIPKNAILAVTAGLSLFIFYIVMIAVFG